MDTYLDTLVCSTCGQLNDRFDSSQFSVEPKQRPPCAICADPRQYVPPSGQQWTTLRRMQESKDCSNVFGSVPGHGGIIEISTKPQVAIEQRAMLYRTDQGNILWDCITYIDDETIKKVKELGGIQAIAISHPHFYATALAWAEEFGAELWLNELDMEWLQCKPTARIRTWKDKQSILGQTLVQVAGHFEGSCILHLPKERALLTADSILVVPSQMITLTWSYPNLIPLRPSQIVGIWNAVKDIDFDTIHGGWTSKDILEDAKAVMLKSVKQLLQHMGDESAHEHLKLL